MVLLVVDTQKGIVDERLYAFKKFVSNIRELIRTAREPVSYTHLSLPTALYCGQGSRRLLPGWAKAAASGRAPAACKSGSVPACAVR